MTEEIEQDVDIMEISLSADEIDEWILKLDSLKETGEKIALEIDNENELEINLDKTEEGEE